MANKQPKKSGSWQRKGFGTPNLPQTAPVSQLRRIETLLEQKKWLAAKTALQSLNQTYPQDRDVLALLVNVCLDTGDMVSCGQACEQLVRLEPRNADAAYALAGTYIANGHPLLAMQALRTAVEKFPNHEQAEKTRTMIADLEASVDEMLADMNLFGEEGLKVALLHEQGQSYLSQGALDLAQAAEEAALQLRPDLVSVRNNLSLIRWQQGHLDDAIAITQQVLDQESDNIHALSNLIHFHYLQGELEQAAPLGDRLKVSQGKAWDGWAKKAEGLSYLRDDAGVLDLFTQTQAADETDSAHDSPLFLHLVAVAMARSGQLQNATQQWQKLLKQSPSYDLARDNLQDISKPIAQRQGAWPFTMTSWLDPQIVPELQRLFQALANPKDEAQIIQATERYLAEHPYIVKLLPILLERGDPPARELMIHLATLVKTPELLEALKAFALGQWGTDEQRYQAAVKLVTAGLLPKQNVRLWIKGQWQAITLLAYEFHDEPSVVHTRPVETLLERAIALLKKDSPTAAKQAEALFHQALQAEPDAPDLHNNLAIAYLQQDREAEAKALLHQIAIQHPDYVLAKASLARFHLKDGEIAAAEALLKPLIARDRFSFTEFGEFADSYIFLLSAQKNLEGAKGWLQMWENVDPDHPKLQLWKTRLEAANLGNPSARSRSPGQRGLTRQR